MYIDDQFFGFRSYCNKVSAPGILSLKLIPADSSSDRVTEGEVTGTAPGNGEYKSPVVSHLQERRDQWITSGS
jgi:hypothetical protein